MSIRRRSILAGGVAAGLAQLTTAVRPPSASAAPLTSRSVSTPAELSAAIVASEPGDEIVMTAGDWPDVHVLIGTDARHGTSEHPILLRAAIGGDVRLTGQSLLSIGRDHWVVDGLAFVDGWSVAGQPVITFGVGATPRVPDYPGSFVMAHHCTIRNIMIEDYNNPSGTDPYEWVYMHGTNHTVERCYFSGKTHTYGMIGGSKLTSDGQPTRHRFRWNYFGQIPQPTGSVNGLEALPPVYSSDHTLVDENIVEHNLFYHCHGETELIAIKGSGNTVRHNTCVESFNKSARLGTVSLRGGSGSSVHGNHLIGVGLRIFGADHQIHNNYIDSRPVTFHASGTASNGAVYDPVSNVHFVNNTMVRTDPTAWASGIAMRLGFKVPASGTDHVVPQDCTISNTVFDWSGGSQVAVEDSSGSDVQFDHCLYWGAPWGIDPLPGATEDDPQLELIDRAILAPGSSSPAVDGGTATLAPSEDILGRPRPSGAGIDIGAHERSSAPTQYAPLTADDVGPDWMSVGPAVACRLVRELGSADSGGSTLLRAQRLIDLTARSSTRIGQASRRRLADHVATVEDSHARAELSDIVRWLLPTDRPGTPQP